jgi:hypothetical protein
VPRLLWELELRGRAAGTADGEPAWIGPGGDSRLDALVAKIPELPPYDAQQRMRAELEILEMTLDAHPFALFEAELERVRRLRPVVASDALRQHVDREVYMVGWKVTSKRTTTSDDEPMCFVTFTDERGRFEASFFPEVYARCALELVRGMGPFLVKGRVEVAFGVAELVASHIKLLDPSKGGYPRARHRHQGTLERRVLCRAQARFRNPGGTHERLQALQARGIGVVSEVETLDAHVVVEPAFGGLHGRFVEILIEIALEIDAGDAAAAAQRMHHGRVPVDDLQNEILQAEALVRHEILARCAPYKSLNGTACACSHASLGPFSCPGRPRCANGS